MARVTDFMTDRESEKDFVFFFVGKCGQCQQIPTIPTVSYWLQFCICILQYSLAELIKQAVQAMSVCLSVNQGVESHSHWT